MASRPLLLLGLLGGIAWHGPAGAQPPPENTGTVQQPLVVAGLLGDEALQEREQPRRGGIVAHHELEAGRRGLEERHGGTGDAVRTEKEAGIHPHEIRMLPEPMARRPQPFTHQSAFLMEMLARADQSQASLTLPEPRS